MCGPRTLSVLIKQNSHSGSIAHYSLLLPDIGGRESRQLLLLGAVSVSALVLGFWEDDDFKDWGGCDGSDLRVDLLREFDSCEDVPLRCIRSCLDAVLLRVRDGGGDGGTGDLSVLDGDSTRAGAVICGTSAGEGVVLPVTCDAGEGSETVAVLPQQPMD